MSSHFSARGSVRPSKAILGSTPFCGNGAIRSLTAGPDWPSNRPKTFRATRTNSSPVTRFLCHTYGNKGSEIGDFSLLCCDTSLEIGGFPRGFYVSQFLPVRPPQRCRSRRAAGLRALAECALCVCAKQSQRGARQGRRFYCGG